MSTKRGNLVVFLASVVLSFGSAMPAQASQTQGTCFCATAGDDPCRETAGITVDSVQAVETPSALAYRMSILCATMQCGSNDPNLSYGVSDVSDSGLKAAVKAACDTRTPLADAYETVFGRRAPAATDAGKPFASVKPELSFDIPGLEFSDVLNKDGKLTVNFLAEYITAVFRLVLGVSTTIAIVMIMVGGLQYVMAAGTGNVKAAKERIRNSIIGLAILFSTFVILYTVNPQLTLFAALELEQIQTVKLVAESGDTGGGVTADPAALQAAGIECPQEGGAGDIPIIAESFIGKVTYRFGGKGKPPPYTFDTKVSKDGQAFSGFCPEGTVCLDCSGFVDLVYACAGLPPKLTSGSVKFANETLIDTSTCSDDGGVETADGSTILVPGDLIGFSKGENGQSASGHVWMYLGDGKLINSAGKREPPGKAVFTQSLTGVCKAYKTLHVIRVAP
ncbi:hypothetical protein EPO34_02410 [Patescibacteria group bacterium]|nr:MAG: hypothetical protein EPO34_02410 [Patescibacteria group bacterium]